MECSGTSCPTTVQWSACHSTNVQDSLPQRESQLGPQWRALALEPTIPEGATTTQAKDAGETGATFLTLASIIVWLTSSSCQRRCEDPLQRPHQDILGYGIPLDDSPGSIAFPRPVVDIERTKEEDSVKMFDNNNKKFKFVQLLVVQVTSQADCACAITK